MLECVHVHTPLCVYACGWVSMGLGDCVFLKRKMCVRHAWGNRGVHM